MSIDTAYMRDAMARKLLRRGNSTGRISLPAVPGMLDEYVTMCDNIFAALGRKFSTEERDHLRALLAKELGNAYSASNRSNIVISYDAPIGTVVNYFIQPEVSTLEETYDNWVATRKPPLFGTMPDARVSALAAEAEDPRTARVLDIGGGTGRNALALARRGHPVDVVELTPRFAEILRAEAYKHLLDVRVIDRDVFEGLEDLQHDYQLIVLSEVVSDFRSPQQLRAIFELAAQCLVPGGQLVFNTFTPRPGYLSHDAVNELAQAARELGQQMYTSIFTGDDINGAVAGLPFELVSNDSVYDYEQANLPAGVWPPTGWYADWVSGLDVFDVPREQSPIEMRWLVYKKTA
ncbi:class I SAM-dependent methyltransferase [Mycobacterium rufum]|uniref:Class I SAM-dependent methyltransferase n=2 Tax=Mycolicibacterium rufum TaxID=318424 RepID=A0A9X3BIJ9_9MYCO|nr:methyltransferase type 12 [Mycolicibacterium rufum]MCV7072174.1 class I SAM-dependent methyltransferase [Mycolicibacterium rufum]